MTRIDGRAARATAKELARRVGLEVRRARPAPHDPPPGPAAGFYPLSPTCQIPRLDFLYELFFGRRGDGLFVEVGGFDGYTYSNTSGLATAGWGGHYLEPVPSSAAQCRARYADNGRIAVHELGIGAADATLTLHVGGALSTSDTRTFDEYRHIDWARSEFETDITVEARQITLDAFLEGQAIEPGFELLVVDVEGSEPSVFAGFDLAAWHPTMLIVELADTHPDLVSSRNEHAALGRTISEAGYVIVYKDCINTVYLRTDRWDATYADSPRPPYEHPTT